MRPACSVSKLQSQSSNFLWGNKLLFLSPWDPDICTGALNQCWWRRMKSRQVMISIFKSITIITAVHTSAQHQHLVKQIGTSERDHLLFAWNRPAQWKQHCRFDFTFLKSDVENTDKNDLTTKITANKYSKFGYLVHIQYTGIVCSLEKSQMYGDVMWKTFVCTSRS